MHKIPSTVLRTAEIEEATNRFFVHPISRMCVRLFARVGVHPNAVSILGMLLGASAALAYYNFESWYMSLAGFLLMIGWHVMDGADGQLARLTGRTSEFGRVLDGICDHLTFALVYLSFALALAPEMGASIWILGLAAGASHIMQAGAYEAQRASFDFWANGKGRLLSNGQGRRRNGARRGALPAVFGEIERLYTLMQTHVTGAGDDFMRRLDGAGSVDRVRLRRFYRAIHLPAMKWWNMLSSNYRTIAIFAACLAGSPVYYFLFEIIVLNTALVILLVRRRESIGRISRLIPRQGAKA